MRLGFNSLVDPRANSHCFEYITDPKNQEAYREILQDSLEEIEEYLTKTEESAVAVSPDKSFRLLRMEAMQDQQLVLEVRRRRKRRKVEIIQAISRLEQGEYGNCSFCGLEISEESLDAIPKVQTCVNCA